MASWLSVALLALLVVVLKVRRLLERELGIFWPRSWRLLMMRSPCCDPIDFGDNIRRRIAKEVACKSGNVCAVVQKVKVWDIDAVIAFSNCSGLVLPKLHDIQRTTIDIVNSCH